MDHPDFATVTDVIAPWAVRVAATLRLADHIAAGVTGRVELAGKAGADPDALRRMMRFLTARGVFTEPEPDVYGLSPTADMLREDHPAGRREWLDLDGAGGRLDSTYVGLLESVRTGGPAYASVHGRAFWEDLAADPELSRSFDRLMAGHAAWFSEVATAYDWSRVRHVVDMGGGTGALLAALLDSHGQLRGTLVDLPTTIAGARHVLDEAGVGQRCELIGSSFFEPWPAGADVYLLSHVLHDWNDERALAILRRGAEATAGGGRLLVLERLAGGQGGTDPALATKMDLRMLALVGGRERSAADFAALAAAAGLACRVVGDTPSGVTLLECSVLDTPIPAEEATR